MVHFSAHSVLSRGFFLLLASLVGFSPASAQGSDEVRFGEPRFEGVGCENPDEDIIATVSPDGGELSVGFQAPSMAIERDEFSHSRELSVNCALILPITGDNEFRVQVQKIDYRGFVSLPKGAKAKLKATYFTRHEFGETKKRRVQFRTRKKGKLVRKRQVVFKNSRRRYKDIDFFKRGTLKPRWSRCMSDVELVLDTSLSVKTNRKRELAQVELNSYDLTQARSKFVVKYQNCD